MSGVHESVRVEVVDLLRKLYRDVVHAARSKSLVDRTYQVNRTYQLVEELLEHDPTILIPQEVRVGDTRKRVDMAFGSIVFELKSEEGEFKEGREKAEREYLPRMPNAKYFVLTTYKKWSIYEVKRDGGRVELKPRAENVDLRGAEHHLKDILTEIVPKVPAVPENIQKLFTMNVEGLLKNLRDAFNALSNDARVKPLYNAYKKVMNMLYGNASEEFYVDLFVRHTLMHMIVLASLSAALGIKDHSVNLCRGIGLGIDVALPYLNWWWAAFVNGQEDLKKKLSEVVEEVVLRVNLLDWSTDTAEDAFRLLYEVLIDDETRRRIGEYYTPPWLVDLVLSRFDLRGKIVLDPFCGSGTFLVRAFHRKVDTGEDPDEAYSSLVGFDANPLAVAVARAELMLAYHRRTGRNPDKPPHVYHADTLAAWLGETLDLLNIQSLLVGLEGAVSPREILNTLTEIENTLTNATQAAYAYCESKTDAECLEREIKRNLEGAKVSETTRRFISNAISVSVPQRLASLINEHGGNSIWALVVISLYAPKILEKFKPDIIVTNPPWIPTTDFNSSYADKLREVLSKSLRKVIPEEKVVHVLNGSDIATAALAMALDKAIEGVGFIMNREQAFYARSPMPAGILATYAVLKHKGKGYLELIDVDFDAFQHGIYPAVVISKQGSGEALYVLSVKEEYRSNYSKSLAGEIYQLNKLGTTYDNYINPSLLYFKGDIKELAKALHACGIITKGQYIMGIFGGELKESQKYAGLALHEWRVEGDVFRFRLWNTKTLLEMPLNVAKMFGVDVYKLVYVGEVNPFCLVKTYDILLSSKGERELREFLKATMRYNYTRLMAQDVDMIEGLIQEVKQGNGVETLSTSNVYVVYRSDRAFTAAVVKPIGNTVLDSHLAAIELNDENMAHYYAAVLNYLAYKVRKLSRVFIHHQFGRPPLAVYIAGLAWGDVDPEIRSEVVKQAKQLDASRKMCMNFANMSKALDWLSKTPEFRSIMRLLDDFIEKKGLRDRLNQALELVSGVSRRGD